MDTVGAVDRWSSDCLDWGGLLLQTSSLVAGGGQLVLVGVLRDWRGVGGSWGGTTGLGGERAAWPSGRDKRWAISGVGESQNSILNSYGYLITVIKSSERK